ncbi:hypothetical protein [Polaribacter sp. Hel1_85]|uniref:hypothetical protein n=1 Tax=Polaribacter sp. Hel1_85 TaxID=1250005 RepID=UPI00052BB978|nr:hypothetical protein [Polaribacter sp. Hel1_85]KGL62435.1 hypothetical protein PHEL85_2229 [Polaribacter sp. Hel1_85]
MKNNTYLIILFLTGILTSSCESNDLDYQNDFEISKEAWLNFKESSNDSYKYEVHRGSVFTPYGWVTMITVLNGEIIERHFKYTSGAEDYVPSDELEWTENQNEINSLENENKSAFYALTLDELYEKSEQEWLIKRKDATSYFESENNGLISTCGYVEDGCMDDCFNGVIIKNIVAL